MNDTQAPATTYAPTIIPSIRYDDARSAIEFLCSAFGFERNMVVEGEDGIIEHCQLRWGSGMVMVGQVSDGTDGRMPGKGEFPGVYVVVPDVQAAHARAVAAGAEVGGDPEPTPYGSSEYGAKDPEGNLWWFGDYQPSAENA